MNKKLAGLTLLALCAACAAPALAAPPTVEMTWMSIANWYFKIGDKRIVMDGYITRVPESLFTPSPVFPKDMYTFTKGPYGVDLPAITKVRNAVLGTDRLDLLLAGHAHHASVQHADDLVTRAGGALVIQAGTATSTRVREQSQSFNVIDIADGRVGLTVECWGGDAFHAMDPRSYEYHDGRWRILKAEQSAH